MWSYPSNSTNPIPLDLAGLPFSVRRRTDLGLTEAKCLVTESFVALNGRLPFQK